MDWSSLIPDRPTYDYGPPGRTPKPKPEEPPSLFSSYQKESDVSVRVKREKTRRFPTALRVSGRITATGESRHVITAPITTDFDSRARILNRPEKRFDSSQQIKNERRSGCDLHSRIIGRHERRRETGQRIHGVKTEEFDGAVRVSGRRKKRLDTHGEIVSPFIKQNEIRLVVRNRADFEADILIRSGRVVLTDADLRVLSSHRTAGIRETSVRVTVPLAEIYDTFQTAYHVLLNEEHIIRTDIRSGRKK